MHYEFRVPVAESYVAALGRATYTFSFLEWGIVWLTETLAHGFLDGVSGMTAGTIAREFSILAESSVDSDAEALRNLASSFSRLVKDRNALLHSVPYTAVGGEQRLLHLGSNGRRDWTESSIFDAALEFEKAAIEANGLFHGGRYEAYTAATGRVLSV
jgi:hypothetical protein